MDAINETRRQLDALMAEQRRMRRWITLLFVLLLGVTLTQLVPALMTITGLFTR